MWHAEWRMRGPGLSHVQTSGPHARAGRPRIMMWVSHATKPWALARTEGLSAGPWCLSAHSSERPSWGPACDSVPSLLSHDVTALL